MYVGIDLALKGKHEACFELPDGKRKRYRFSSLPSQVSKFLDWVKKHGEPIEGFVMEPTGASWKSVGRFLDAAGYKVFLFQSDKASTLRKFFSHHAKTDQIDAFVLAKGPVVDPKGVYAYRFPSPRLEALKKLVKLRNKRVHLVTERTLEFQGWMDDLLPGWRQVLKSKQLLTKVGRFFLRHGANVSKLQRMSAAAFEKKMAPIALGWSKHILASLQTLVMELKGHCVEEFPYEVIQDQIRLKLDLLEKEERNVASLDEKIAALYAELDPNKVLESIPGIGVVLAPEILAMTGDPSRFSNVRQYRAFCGLCPKKFQSGNKDVPGLPMTKAGPSLLKRALHLAAQNARREDPQFAEFYHRLLKRGKHHNVIIGALAAKLAVRVYTVLKRNAPHASTPEQASKPIGYELRDLKGHPVEKKVAKAWIVQTFGKNLKEQKEKLKEERLKIEAVLKDSSRCIEASTCSKAQSRT